MVEQLYSYEVDVSNDSVSLVSECDSRWILTTAADGSSVCQLW